MKVFELTPINGRKSFYGKAHVQVDDNGVETLISYGTPIIRRDGDMLIRLYNGYTSTTGTHIKLFCGLTKKEFLAMPV